MPRTCSPTPSATRSGHTTTPTSSTWCSSVVTPPSRSSATRTSRTSRPSPGTCRPSGPTRRPRPASAPTTSWARTSTAPGSCSSPTASPSRCRTSRSAGWWRPWARPSACSTPMTVPTARSARRLRSSPATTSSLTRPRPSRRRSRPGPAFRPTP